MYIYDFMGKHTEWERGRGRRRSKKGGGIEKKGGRDQMKANSAERGRWSEGKRGLGRGVFWRKIWETE